MGRQDLRTLSGLLAGAGVVGVVQALTTSAPVPARFLATAMLASNAAACGGLMLGLVLLRRLAARGPRPGTAFWLGAAIGAAPLLAAWFPLPAALGAALLPAAASPWLGARTPAAAGGRLVLAALLLFFLAGAVLPDRTRTLEEFLALPPAPGGGPEGPDVLLVSIDTLRADAVGAQRPPELDLPAFDRLRRQGLSAPYALSSSNQTLPGHAGMLSGLDAMEHGVRENREMVPQDLEMLPEVFREHGWRTAAVLSNAVLMAESGMAQGFELYDDSSSRRSPIVAMAPVLDRRSWLGWALGGDGLIDLLRPTLFRLVRQKAPAADELRAAGGRQRGRVTTDHALRVLDRLLAQDRPWFLFLHYLDPHHPYGGPAPFRGRYTAGMDPPEDRFLPEKPGGQIKDGPLAAVAAGLEQGDPAARHAAEWFHRTYMENVAYVDSLLGEVLDRVETGGRPTVVLVTSDHGEQFGEHGLMLHANSLYEPLLRVPFLLRAPGLPAGQEVEGEVHLADVFPTLLDLAGLPWKSELRRGRPVHRGLPARPHVAADEAELCVRQAGWKWIGRWQLAGPPAARHLFQLLADPGELQDRLGDTEPPPGLDAAREEAVSRDTHARRQAASAAFPDRGLDELGYAEGGVMAGTGDE